MQALLTPTKDFFMTHLAPSQKYASDIARMKSLLERYYGLNFVNFSRFFNNGSSLGLYSHPDVIENLLKSKSYPLMLDKGGVFLPQGGYFFHEIIDYVSLTLSGEALKQYQATLMGEGYQLARGYAVILKTETYSEVFFFSALHLAPVEEKYYITQIKDELFHFCYFYLDDMEKIIKSIAPDREVFFYQNKRTLPEELKRSENLKHDALSACVAKRYWFSLPRGEVHLTLREFQTLQLFVEGMTYQSIADFLDLSRRTVETYAKNIKDKLGDLNRNELRMILQSSIYGPSLKHFSKNLL
jgi:DNA-binding CsgD family transcriptional regulator